jgi:hypothetical protein
LNKISALNFHQRGQWLAEIKKHAPILGENTMQFRSADEDNTLTRLKSNDIVLTTYWELCQSLPQPPKKLLEEWRNNEVNEFGALQKWVKDHMDEMGLLHQVTWYRVSFQVPTGLEAVINLHIIQVVLDECVSYLFPLGAVQT